MGAYFEYPGMGGGKFVDARDLFQDRHSGSSLLRIRDVGGDPPHGQDFGRFPTQGFPPAV